MYKVFLLLSIAEMCPGIYIWGLGGLPHNTYIKKSAKFIQHMHTYVDPVPKGQFNPQQYMHAFGDLGLNRPNLIILNISGYTYIQCHILVSRLHPSLNLQITVPTSVTTNSSLKLNLQPQLLGEPFTEFPFGA